jgi:PAS domain S-box-containing protein
MADEIVTSGSVADRAPIPPLVAEADGWEAGSLQDFIADLATEFVNLASDAIPAAITDALGRIGRRADVDRAYVFVITGDRMTNTNEWCSDGTEPQIGKLQDVPLAAYEWCMARILRRDLLHIANVQDLPADQPDRCLLMEEGIQSLLAVPMMSRSQVIGFVGFDAVRSAKRWTSEIVGSLRIVAAIFANAIERAKAEDALRNEKEFFTNLVDTMGSLVIVLAPDGRCIQMNRAFSDLTGLSIEELSGKGWQRVVPEDSREAARRALRSALSGVRTQFEGLIHSANDGMRVILWSGAVIRGADGATGYVVLAGVDLTETLHLREQVEQGRRIDSLGRVAATIAHEFNNVLMAIQPSAEIIRRRPDQLVEVQRCAERIQRAVKRGVRITGEVTRFTRPAEPIRQRLDATEWLHNLVDEMRGMLADRPDSPVMIEVAPQETHPAVYADPYQLHQVFSNLILNAAEATPPGGQITISVREIDVHEYLIEPGMESRWVHFEVRDTGAGISPAVLDRIFEPLFTTKKRGTGLGLAVSHQIIKAHGGELSVETALGRGTTFHVFLRAADVES